MFVHNNHSVLRVIGVLLLSAFISLPATAHQVESTQPVTVNSTLVMATGTVSELTVTNQVTGATLHYFGLQLDQGTVYALAASGLDPLTDGARITATGSLAGNILNVAFFSVVAPAQVAGRKTTLGQKQKTISGTLAVYHKDFLRSRARRIWPCGPRCSGRHHGLECGRDSRLSADRYAGQC